MFTDRFVKVPVCVFDREEKELTGKETLIDSYIKINPFELSEYRPGYSNDPEDEECVNIIMKNGEKSMVRMNINEFEKLLNYFDK